MYRARRSAVLALCVVVAYGLQLSAAVAAPPQGLPPCRDDHPAHVDLSQLPPCQPDEPPAEVPPVEEPPAEAPSTDQPASNDLPPCTEDHPAVPDLSDLPLCQDEAEDPPADEGPAEVPPVEEPPAEEPSTDQPASNDLPPCTEDHPAVPDLSDLPPCQEETPEAGDPPADEVPAEVPPVEEPPAEEPSTDPPASNDLPPCTEDHPAVPDLTDLPPCQGETPGAEPPLDEEQPAPPEETLSEEQQQPTAVVVSEEDVSTEEPQAEELVAEDPPATQAPADQPGAAPPTDPAAAPTDPDSGDDLPTTDLQPEPTEQAASSVPIELTTRAGDGLTIDVSKFVPEGSAFMTLAYLAPTNGTLSVEGLVATYTPAPGFYGVDRFTLRVCNRSAVCVDLLASVAVPPVNDFLLTTGAALTQFFSSIPTSDNGASLFPDTAQRVMVPLAGLVAIVGASLWFGLDSVGSVLRRCLALLAARS